MRDIDWDRMRAAAVGMAHHCGRHQDAEDIAQDALLGIWRSGVVIDPERQANLAAVAARRRIVDRIRREQRIRDARAIEFRMGGVIEYAFGAEDERREVAEALDLGEVPHLFGRGLTRRQIARATGIPEGSVASGMGRIQQRARAELAARIGGAA